MCCDNLMTQRDQDLLVVGKCDDCGACVDSDGCCIELDDCSYSPLACSKCGHRPCDLSC